MTEPQSLALPRHAPALSVQHVPTISQQQP